ncbi:MAG: hypothetical protein SGPRY_010549, partial [Prymnesium sp.]
SCSIDSGGGGAPFGQLASHCTGLARSDGGRVGLGNASPASSLASAASALRRETYVP